MGARLGVDGSDLFGFPESPFVSGGPFVAVACNPVVEWCSWGQIVPVLQRLQVKSNYLVILRYFF